MIGQFSIVVTIQRFNAFNAIGTGWVLLGNPDGTMQFAFGKGGSSVAANFPSVSSFASVLDDHWHHSAGVFTGTQLAIYQDGLLANTLSVTNLPATNSRDVEIGRWCGSPNRAFHGLIDEVSFYGRALTAAEIASVYNAGPAPANPLYRPLFYGHRFRAASLRSPSKVA